MKRHRNYLRAPAQTALDITRGYQSKSLMGRELIHLVPGEPYARPLCGARGDLWDHSISDKPQFWAQYDLCGGCIAKAEEIRKAKGE